MTREALRLRSGLSRKGLLIVAVPLACQVLLALAILYVNAQERRQQEEQVRAAETTLAAHRLLSLLLDIETASRGYAISTDERFLQQFDEAVTQIPAVMTRLRSLTTQSADAVGTLETLSKAVIDHQNAQRLRVARGQRDEAIIRISTGEGKVRMDALRGALTDFFARQHRLGAQRSEAGARARRGLLIVVVAGLAISVVLAILTARFFRYSITQRLARVVDNTRRLEAGQPLSPRQVGDDEIAELDQRFHDMAAALERNRIEIERSNRELESFSYSVSHDLRAPLRAVNGYARMLEEDCAATLGDEGRRYVRTIRTEARRMGDLIDDLLALSRLGRNQLQLADLDLESVVRDALGDVSAGEANVEVTLRPLPFAHADRGLTRQLFVNLLSNAIKFSRRTKFPQIEIGGESREGENLYWVRDNGVGFDSRYADKLFGVFERLHSLGDFEGTGIGLAIVQRVVERHGGRVWAESKEGEGACFYFTLPRASEEKAA